MTNPANPKGDEIVETMAWAIEAELFKVQDVATKQGIITPERIAEAAIAALSAAGYAIVPVEPTLEMIAAASDTALEIGGLVTVSDEYKAMIRAASKEG